MIKWESLGLSRRSYSSGEVSREKERGASGVVRCTSEGIERRILIGETAARVLVPERFKVIALMACVMCLCNADRVVMSVAIVPLADKFGWSSSFLGVVQVIQKLRKKAIDENCLISLWTYDREMGLGDSGVGC